VAFVKKYIHNLETLGSMIDQGKHASRFAPPTTPTPPYPTPPHPTPKDLKNEESKLLLCHLTSKSGKDFSSLKYALNYFRSVPTSTFQVTPSALPSFRLIQKLTSIKILKAIKAKNIRDHRGH
jgi:hypothetical protein